MTRFTSFAMRDFAELSITNGVETVDLINPITGLHLDAWRPVEAGIKGGGVWYDNPMSDGRRPAFARYENAVETFELKIGEKCTDDLYDRQLSKLRALCVASRDFFTRKWRAYSPTGVGGAPLPNRPVYIRARGINETNMRFAIVYTATIPEEEDPYSPISAAAMADNITLVFERGHWQHTIPEQADDLAISGMSDYMGMSLGNAWPVIPPEFTSFRRPNSNTQAVLVGNKQQVHNLTHVFRFEDGIGWSTNLLDDPLPMQLFRATGTQVDDLMAYGIKDDPTNFTDGVFSSLVNAISVAPGDVISVPEYYDGVGWVALSYQGFGYNGNFGFGLDTISWRMPDDWAQFDPAGTGDTGWYVRLRVTSVGGTGDGDLSGEYYPYTIAWAHTHIEPGVVNGDLPALVEIKLRNVSDKGNVTPADPPSIHANRVIVGLRSVSRDPEENPLLGFTPYIDLGETQNQNQSVAIDYYADTTVVPSTLGWGQNIALYAPGGASGMTRQMQIRLPAPLYYGAYRMFVRVRQVGGSGRQVKLQAIARFGFMPVFGSEPREIPVVEGNNLIDFGSCSLVPDAAIGYVDEGVLLSSYIYIDLYAETAAALQVEFYDLVLMPIDEWSGDFIDTVGTVNLTALGDADVGGSRLFIDSAIWQHGSIRALLYHPESDGLTIAWQAVSNGPAIIQANRESLRGQRLWFLFAKRYDANFEQDDWRSNHEHSDFIEIEYVQRYLGSRGTH